LFRNFAGLDAQGSSPNFFFKQDFHALLLHFARPNLY
jgi:hypothetical protein